MTLLRCRTVQLALLGWMLVNVLIAALSGRTLPLDLPDAAQRSPADYLVDFNVGLAEAFLIMVLVYALTRRREVPDLAARAPERAMALRETLLLLAYGAGGLGFGFVLARAFGWHSFGLHLAGSVYGTHEHVERAEVISWAVYNLVVYAAVPLLFFRRRYSARALNLRSGDRRGDALVIAIVLLVETSVQFVALRPEIFDLGARQLLLAAPLTFVLYLAGAVLPAMVFIYAILVPRFLKLTGSTATTVILGGLTYAALHLWDAWAVRLAPGDGHFDRLPAAHLFRARHGQDLADRTYRQRVGACLGLPRAGTSHSDGHPSYGAHLRDQMSLNYPARSAVPPG